MFVYLSSIRVRVLFVCFWFVLADGGLLSLPDGFFVCLSIVLSMFFSVCMFWFVLADEGFMLSLFYLFVCLCEGSMFYLSVFGLSYRTEVYCPIGRFFVWLSIVLLVFFSICMFWFVLADGGFFIFHFYVKKGSLGGRLA